jgi:glycine dehydrogenase
MVTELTGFPVANASLLDEGTAASEAMIFAFNNLSRKKKKAGVNKFYVSDKVFPQTLEVLRTKAEPLGIEMITGCPMEQEVTEDYFGILIQYPDQYGSIKDLEKITKQAKENEVMVCVAADLLSLTMLKPPAEWGADVAIGTTQRFGIPMGYGGPHAAYFATTEDNKRKIPGRIIGVSKDAEGNHALRMALQTREQHIKREKATSNICTAQALLATMAGMYAAYHGPQGLKEIATDIHSMAVCLDKEIQKLGYKQLNENYFDTLKVEIPESVSMADLKKDAEELEINFRYIDEKTIGISFDETKGIEDVNTLLKMFASLNSKDFKALTSYGEHNSENIQSNLVRVSKFLTQDVFNSYHSETEMMRYMKHLEIKDLALNRAMIPLGSCTMKLNAAAELIPISWPEFGRLHPFIPKNQAEGYYELINNLEEFLKEITGYDRVSFQPNSGAAGEYTGLMTIRKYHESKGEKERDICLIPASAHGTNPASAVMAGMQVVVVKTNENGEIDIEDLKAKADQHKETLSAAMITYPSTHGVFEENILEVMDIIHNNGGLVYMDGANMNAQVGFTNPGIIGADVCHLNLHKTFAIPHGGGGPGVGPIGVAKHLSPFLPNNTFIETGGKDSFGAVSSAPFGSASILSISYAYILMLGGKGLQDSTKYAILNTNYIAEKLKGHYDILYTGSKGRAAHEMILDCNKFYKTANVTVVEIAKRLMDYGLHAPTVAFPVHGTLMVEPTESEPLYEIDRFIEAMVAIREEIREIEEGKADKENNAIKNAPHTMAMVTVENWDKPYSREKAAFPTNHTKKDKYWPKVTKIDDGYGDRNLVCTCDPIESYESDTSIDIKKL